jgi:NitT/TauT family transport system permease protein
MRRLLNIRPKAGARLLMGAAPLIALVLFYLMASGARHALNPADKVLPTLLQMGAAIKTMAFDVDLQQGAILLWTDTAASLARLAIALSIATSATLLLGIALGLLPIARASLGPLIAVIAVIPPIAVLPILFIALGLGETSKIALIVIGIAPTMVRDLAAHVAAIPEEQIVKAQTLGASSWQIALRVALPQALPRLAQVVRLSLGPAWVFLISSEAIASDVGLGYRIFLVRRYLSMDVIIPYVAWISLLAVMFDIALAAASRNAFPWAHQEKGA